MRSGVIKLFCPICGAPIGYNGSSAGQTIMYHREFGIVCTKQCHVEAEMKYARMILGKDDV